MKICPAFLLPLGACLAATIGAVTPAIAATYTVADLGSAHFLNGSQSKVLNEQGQVIANTLGDDGRAFLFSGGTWHELGRINPAASGRTATFARGLNNGGLVVGDSFTGGVTGSDIEQSDGFFRSGTGGTFTAMALASTSNLNLRAVAYACNDQGTIVGNVINDATGALETFLFVPGTGVISRVSDGVHSFAINRLGDVLGTLTGLVPQTAVNGVPLPKIAQGFIPQAINNSGQILLSGNDVHRQPGGWGLIYDYGTGKATVLENLSPQSAGYTTFLDLNDAGHVVGRGADANITPHAVLCTPEAGLISLNDLGLQFAGNPIHLTEAHGINNAGQIVCNGYITDPGVVQIFLLTPDAPPPPPSLVATFDGLASVGGVSLGSIVLTVSKTNVCSVKLTAPGVVHSFKVTLDSNGAFNGTTSVKGKTLTVNLAADAAHQKFTGTIADGSATYTVDTVRRSKLGIFAGNYTALLQLTGPANPALPQGIGHAQIKVSKTGSVKLTGVLGDNSKVSCSTFVGTNGTWPLYSLLYTKAAQPGSIAGLMTFDRAAADSDCAGTLKWSKPGDFTTDVSSRAALYRVVKGAQLLRFTDPLLGTATFAFGGGDQSLAPHTLSVSDKNAVAVTDPTPNSSALAVKLSASNGAMTGSFLHPATNAKTSFTGVVQQKLNLGAGVFPGQTTTGSVLLTPQ